MRPVTTRVGARNARRLAPAAGLLVALAVATPADASVTIGHVLGTGAPGELSCFPTCTLRQATLAPEDGLSTDGLVSPVNGTVTSFGFGVVAANQNSDLTIRLRVLRGRTGVASSSPLTLRDADGIQTFPTQLPIAIGDGIGLDTIPAAPPVSIGIARLTAAGNSSIELFSPPLTDGGAEQSPQATPNGVLDMNAVIEPTSAFTFGKVVVDRKKGTASVPVTVANPGSLALAGTGVRKATAAAAAPGMVRLTVRATGASARTLRRSGKATVSAKVTFTPKGGEAATQSKRVPLRRRR